MRTFFREWRMAARNSSVLRKGGKVVRTTLPNAIQGRGLARRANASSLGKDYGAAEEQFLAEAVREHLIANGALTKDKITAVGYGAARH